MPATSPDERRVTGVRRNQWALPVLVAALVALPLLELWLLLRVGDLIGALPTIAILVLEAAFGAWLMRREGGRAWQALPSWRRVPGARRDRATPVARTAAART